MTINPAYEAGEPRHALNQAGVPTMFIAELAVPRFERFALSSLRTGMMGGAPCPAEVMKQMRSRMEARRRLPDDDHRKIQKYRLRELASAS